MPPEVQRALDEIRKQIADLKEKQEQDIRSHQHNGLTSTLVDWDIGIDGLFETVSTAPTGVPKNAYDQIKIYVNGSTYRFYWYDMTGATWHYVTATA